MAKKSNNHILSGNVGEWSEIYVFFRLLAEGKMDVADDRLIPIPNEFYRILEILRKEASSENNYLRADDNIIIKIKNDITGEIDEFTMSISKFATNADSLLDGMKKQSGKRTASYPHIQSFMEEIGIHSIKDIGHKRDITIAIEDFHTGSPQIMGFSIKSFVGKQSTLFNPAPGTNFIYKVIFPDNVKVDCDEFNKETYNGKPGKISYRLKKIKELGGEIIFDSVQSQCLWQNLRTIDTGLPVILANALLIKYLYNLSKWEDIVKKLNELNPMDFRVSADSPVYEYKIKRFLQDAAMGMTPESEWDGFYDANGGQIIVKKNGDIVCYHIYELNRYLKYLFDSTKLEQPATSEDENNPGHVEPNPSKHYQFGWLYQENGEYFIKINLQVRFK